MPTSEILSSEPALLSIDGAVATLTLNRPEAFNAINLPIARTLERLAAEVEAAKEVRVLVLQGNGRAFCAGGDLATMADGIDDIANVVAELLHHYHRFIATIRRMDKIVLASVHGSAAGAGLSLAFVCDLCIAASDVRFAPAYGKLGVSPDGGGTAGLVEAVGPRRALQIFLAEDGFSAEQADRWGLLARLVPPEQLKAATAELAQRLARNAPAALAATKRLVQQSQATPLPQQLDAEAEAIIGCMTQPGFADAVRAFVAKKKG